MRTIKSASWALVAGLILLAYPHVSFSGTLEDKQRKLEEKATRDFLRASKSEDIQKRAVTLLASQKDSERSAEEMKSKSLKAQHALLELAEAEGEAASALSQLAETKARLEEKNSVARLFDARDKHAASELEKAAAKALSDVQRKTLTATRERRHALIKEQQRALEQIE